MEADTRTAHLNDYCRGCLARNRVVERADIAIDYIYCTIINKENRRRVGRAASARCNKSQAADEPERLRLVAGGDQQAEAAEEQVPGPLVLCWECTARARQFLDFRGRCKRSNELLLRHMLTPTNITSLSKLSIVRNNNIININHTYNQTQNNEFYSTHGNIESQKIPQEYKNYTQTQSELTNYNDLNNKYQDSESYDVNTEQFHTGISVGEYHSKVITTGDSYRQVNVARRKISTDETHKRETDIQFIKIEEDAVLEEYYDDDFDHQDDIDDKNFAVVLEPGYENKTKVKSKRSKKAEIDNDFNDSDEEPLKNKKRKKTVKERKHKKKKDNDTPKTRKTPANKREKPAGVVSNPRVSKKLQQLNVGEGQLEMVVLSWEEVEEERQKALSSVVFTRHEYRCADCIVGFNHKFKLDNHMKKHDPSAGAMACSVCAVRCRDAHALCAHRRRHRVRWRCCSCGETSSRAAVAADHVAREHHAPPPTHTCTVCGHAEPTLGKLRNHIKNHAERQKCELCGKTFRDRTSLRTHLFIHSGEKEYSCGVCGKQFLFKKAMQVHLVTHDAPAHLYCHQCDMTFKNRMSYTQHMKYSLKHIDPAKLKFACALCDKKFAKATRLREHHLAVHLKATPVACTLPGCSFACSSRPVLRTHIRMVHRNARALRNHVCDTCGKTYTTKKSLEGHLRSHTGERPFACGQCRATFGYEAALYNHNKLVHRRHKASRRPSQPPVTLQVPEPQPSIP